MAKEYTRIRGRGFQYNFGAGPERFGFTRLWLAKDHILLVTSMGYSESYKRFFFRDIRGMTITRTWRRMIGNIILGVIAALFAIPLVAALMGAMPVDEATAVGYIFGGLVTLFVICALVNTLRGPTCAFHITTAIQTEKLPSLDRVGRARKFVERVRPLILTAQEQPSPAPPPPVPS